MNTLNFKHLRYFWVVARAGSIARACEQLHLTPHCISGQLATLESALGSKLFRRSGRSLELTEIGRRTLTYADEIFSLGDELSEMLREPSIQPILAFRVGIAEVVPKSIAHRLIEPVLRLDEPVRLVCREGPLDSLLIELSVHRLDMVIADRVMPSTAGVHAYSHFLGESELSVFAAHRLADTLGREFPACIDNAPFLLPGTDVAIRPHLVQWFDENRVCPRVVGEFDDSALLKAFGQKGAGLFVAPAATADYVCAQYDVRVIGTIDSVKEQLYAITTERRIKHPAVLAVHRAAHSETFGGPASRRGVQPANRPPAVVDP